MAERGRPTKYKPEYADQARKLCELGATNADLADFFGVGTSTIDAWLARYEDFQGAVKASREIANDRVERRLYERAMGYSYDAVKIFNAQGEPLTVPYREHVPPDTTAMIFWLKNRKPAEWRDKQDHEHSGNLNLLFSSDDESL